MGMSRVFFDTNLFIYLIEDYAGRGQRVFDILEKMSDRHDELVTSTLTLGEVLVKPLSAGDLRWADRYETVLNSAGVTVINFDKTAARFFAQIRQDKSIKPPDAIQLSCAAIVKCDLFITNDDRLSSKIIPGIHFITSLDRAPY
jgi:predicted nucleic acid-binding protein